MVEALYQGQRPPGELRFRNALTRMNTLATLSRKPDLRSASRMLQLALLHVTAETDHHDPKDAAMQLLNHLLIEAEGDSNALKCPYALVHWDGEDACLIINDLQV